jgi:hypothetical protein
MVERVAAVWSRKASPEHVRAVPPGERIVDRHRELGEGVIARSREDASGSRPQANAAPFDEVDADRQPVGRHNEIVSDNGAELGSCD